MEQAEQVIRAAMTGTSPALRELIHTAIIEATNAEIERRRAVEAERDRLRRIVDAFSAPDQPVRSELDWSETHLRLRILNPATGEWWVFSGTRELPHVQGEVQRGR